MTKDDWAGFACVFFMVGAPLIYGVAARLIYEERYFSTFSRCARWLVGRVVTLKAQGWPARDRRGATSSDEERPE